MNDTLPCSDRCHETMTTDGAWFIHEWYITMLWPLFSDDDNWWSMIHTKGIYYHDLSVVMRRCQLTEHVSYMNDILPCSVRCHETMITDQAWQGYISMPNRCDRTETTVGACFILVEYHHALTAVMRWSEQGNVSFIYVTCSVSCHRLMTMVGAW